jgi:hypothetical protein
MTLSGPTNGTKRPRILVVRDRERAALQNPHPREFRGRYDMSYLHLSDVDSLPVVDHAVFNCERLTERVHELLVDALRAKATVTIIARHIDAACAALAETGRINVIPAYGFAGQIMTGTLRSALATILQGTPVVATGFVKNSIAPASDLGARSAPWFTRMLREVSAIANSGTPVVMAVLAQQRTGSKFLHDLIGWTVSGAVDVVHEHEVPSSSALVDPDRPLFDQLITAPDADKNSLRRAILRQTLLGAERRYIFVPVREPRARLISYFLRLHKKMLRQAFDSERGTFRDLEAIQHAFDEFTRRQVKRQRSWYRLALLDPFGLDILDARPTEDGVLVAESGPNTLIVLPIEKLDDLATELEAVYGSDTYTALHEDSARNRGDQEMAQIFMSQVRFSPDVWATLMKKLPRVAHIHPQSAEGATDRAGRGPREAPRRG